MWRRKHFEEAMEQQRKFYEQEFERYVKVLEHSKKEAAERDKNPKDRGALPHYDYEERIREFDR